MKGAVTVAIRIALTENWPTGVSERYGDFATVWRSRLDASEPKVPLHGGSWGKDRRSDEGLFPGA